MNIIVYVLAHIGIHFIMSDHKIAMFPTVTEFWKGQFIRLHFSIESAKGAKYVEIFSEVVFLLILRTSIGPNSFSMVSKYFGQDQNFFDIGQKSKFGVKKYFLYFFQAFYECFIEILWKLRCIKITMFIR